MGAPNYDFLIAALQSENEALVKELRATQERFEIIYNTASTGIVIGDREGRVLQANPAFCRMLGFELNELVGMSHRELTHPSDLPAEIKLFEKFQVGIIPSFTIEKRCLRKDKSVIWSRLAISRSIQEGAFCVGMIENIDERKRVEKELEIARYQSAFLADLGKLAVSSLDQEVIASRIASFFAPYLDDWCAVLMLDETVAPRFSSGLDRIFPDPRSALESLRAMPAIKRVARLQTPVHYRKITPTDVPEDDFQVLLALNAKSFLALPLISYGRFAGFLICVSISELHRFGTPEVRLAQEIGTRLRVAFDNAIHYQESQNAIHQREEFISIASHELKNPLTPIRMQLQLVACALRDGDLDTDSKREDLQRLVEASDQQIDKITRLIDDMLDVSRIRSGHFALAPGRVELSCLVTETIERFRTELSKAGCPVTLALDSTVIGNWDRLRIEQVFVNLLTNAMKYGAQRPIHVSVGKSDQEALLSVQDLGIGIAPSDFCKIFEPFERAVSFQKAAGIGLGLFIAQQIVKNHGGTIEVHSQLGAGSTFTVRLPLAHASTTSLI